MRFKNITMLLLVAILGLFSVHNTASASTVFQDVPKTNGAYDEINYLVNRDVISGYTENGKHYFKPNNFVTRGQAAKMVVIATGNKGLQVKQSSFDDIKVTQEVSLYAERVLSKGWFQHTSGRNFSPNMVVSRMEMAKIISNAYDLDVNQYADVDIPFKDVAKTSIYYKYIAAVYYNGITQGKTTSTFDPKSGVTRAQFASFVARASSEKFRLDLPLQGVGVPDASKALGEVEITTNGLNVRSSAVFTGTANIVGQANKGDILKYYEATASYYKVAYKGEFAYVSKAYAVIANKEPEKPSTPKPTPTPVPDASKALGEVEITTSGLNVRSSTVFTGTANIVGQANKGDILKYYEVTSSYYKVAFKGEFAYISKAYAKIVGDDGPTASLPGEGVEKPVTTATTGIATVNSLSVREKASASSDRLGVLSRGEKVPVHSISGNWAKVTFKGQTAYISKTYLRLKNTSGSAVKGRVIVIDPGHGGKDPGAVSPYSGVTEKQIVLNVSLKLKALLEAKGAIVHLTRSTDKFVDLNDRPQYAINKFGEMFISIHANAASAASGNGAESFVSVSNNLNTLEDQALAKFVNDEIVENAAMKDRGVRKYDYLVIRKVAMPAILVELGFVTNKADEAKLISSKYQTIYAESIYNGIMQYYAR